MIEEIEDVIGIEAEDAPQISAKTGLNVDQVLEEIVAKVPAPTGDPKAPLQALIFDSLYDAYKGVIVFCKMCIRDRNEDNAEKAGSTSDGKIDINTAAKNELMTLSGIGEAKADAIVRYREEHGEFQKIEVLMEVEGIKEGVFQKVKDQIKI